MRTGVLEDHHHVYVPADGDDRRTLLLLHGTGGDERDLLPIGRALAPDANLLSPRGRILEHGMPRWFRRLAEGVLDEEDLKARAGHLADFVGAAADAHGFDASRVVAFGYSNGANVASGVLLTRPGALAGAVLARAMVPFEPTTVPAAKARPSVLLAAGRQDPYSRSPETEHLAKVLESAGARVDVHWADAGHELTPDDVEAARRWLADH